MGLNVYSILLPPYVALTITQPINDITKIGADVQYGVCDAVNYNGFTAQVGESYLFKKTDAQTIVAGGTEYYLVEEGKLIFQAIIPVV